MNNLKKGLKIACLKNQEKGIKSLEYALQEVIEKHYPNKIWWEVCKVQIFTVA